MTDLTKLGVWTCAPPPGVDASIGANTGILKVTGYTSPNLVELVPCTFTYGDIVKTVYQPVSKVSDPPTNAGTPGTTSGSSESTTVLGATTSTSYDTANATSPTLRCTAGAAGKIKCSASLSFKRTPGTETGATGAVGKWQWRPVGGSMTDIAAEVSSSTNATTTANPGDPTMNRPGGLNVTMTKTGLTPGVDYELRFIWKRSDVSGSPNNVYAQSGTMTADGTVS